MFHTHAKPSQLQVFYIAVLAAFRQQTGGQKTLAEFGKDLISSRLRLKSKSLLRYENQTKTSLS
jgi:hypothetical protein